MLGENFFPPRQRSIYTLFFLYDRITCIIIFKEFFTMSKHSDELRTKYINNPPEGLTADDIRNMSEDDLLDMDYFLNEDDDFDEDFPGTEGFYLF